tara:strand:+ start:187 stop:396 length:210 start_codon:yes stop_codon:yes gene_type:complete
MSELLILHIRIVLFPFILMGSWIVSLAYTVIFLQEYLIHGNLSHADVTFNLEKAKSFTMWPFRFLKGMV